MKHALLLLVIAGLASGQPQCVEISGTWVLAGDLSGAVPALQAMAPETRLLRGPVPGSRRVLRASDWRTISASAGIPIDAAEVCIVAKARQIPLSEWEESLSTTLEQVAPAARWRILATSTAQVPAGTLELPMAGLSRIGEDRYLWHGAVRDPQGSRTAVWVRFECQARQMSSIAVRDLAAGDTLSTNDYVQRERPAILGRDARPEARPEQGDVLRRSIPTGAEIRAADITRRLAVRRGQRVQVLVQGTGAELVLEAVAVTEGRPGESVSVENPVSRRRFQAVVEGEGRTVIQIAGKGPN